MTLTTDQRREINRENGKKSQGPRTEEGKAKSRKNALKHGLRAEVLAMPHEDPTIAAARAESWNNFYLPASPAAQHLVNECVRATIMSDRCHAFHDAVLAKQVRDARYEEVCRDADEVTRFVARLAGDPANTVAGLSRFGAGCRYMIERWEHLGAILDQRGWWTSFERDEATQLYGQSAENETIKANEVAWTVRLFNLVARGKPAEQSLEWLMDAKHFPTSLWSEYGMEVYPDTDQCRSALKSMVADRLRALRPQAEKLAEAFDRPDNLSAPDRALILQDEKAAKLFLRYLAESRSTFHRSFKELTRTLDSDREAGAIPLAVSPNEPNADVQVEAETPLEPPSEPESDEPSAPESADSPNEPNFPAPVETASAEKSPHPGAESDLTPDQRAA